MKKIVVLGLIMTILAVSASAQTPRERVYRHRVRESVRSGDLTRAEMFDLRRDQLRYDMMERRARRDGEVTPLERKRLMRKKAENRRELFRYKHNRQRRLI